MIDIHPNTIIYILCPANFHTGGAELLHQLCSQLVRFNVDARMFYYNPRNANPVDEFYKKYHLNYATNIIDSPENIFICYEGPTEFIHFFKNIRRVMWWLSADNYVIELRNTIQRVANYVLAEPMPKIFYFGNPADDDVLHFVQSEHARNFIELNGIPKEKIQRVEDYLNPAFMNRAKSVDLTKKENIVAFNPRKGLHVTNFLASIAPNLNWQPIQNMTPEQVQALLAKSKVYIDFGHHPGKDRIPREAAISGCVVITGKRGSAGNDIDVNIPAEFKFDETEESLKNVIEKIHEVFADFTTAYEKQSAYREKILGERELFERDVADAFNLPYPPSSESVAIAQGLTEKSLAIANVLFMQKGKFLPTFIIDDEQYISKNFLPYINNFQNRTFINLAENHSLEIISSEDAQFLYSEKRITKFALLNPSDNELENFRKKIHVASNDLLILTNN